MALNVFAQDTIDTTKVTEKFLISSSGNFSIGNVNRELFTNKISYSRDAYKTDINIGVSYIYGSQDNKLKEDEINFNTSIKVLRHKPTYVIGFAVLDKSYKRRIEYRHSLGVGLGKYLIRKDSSNLSVSLALVNQVADYSTFEDIHIHRMSLRINGKHYIKKSYLTYTLWFQPAIEYPTNIANFKIDYNIPLFKSVFFRISYVMDYDDLIMEQDVEPLDHILVFGFQFKVKNIHKNTLSK
ncbi:MAG: DUF481 domain-containing protein [Cytophagales bacterium]|nr:DUF481 domain-containing protein [Cytophagales bacterium]